MARPPVNPPRKQRTREHVLADLSANHLEKFALQCGFAVDRVRHDYGLDLAVFTFDEAGFLESGVIWIQLKASDRPKVSRDANSIVLRVDRRDVLAWIVDLYPVILMMYDAGSDRAYWLAIQSHFAGTDRFARLRGKTVTIRIPFANVVDASAMQEFTRRKKSLFGSDSGQS